MELPDSAFAGAQTILDIGGWFKPEHRATHVVDLMPWETRASKLTLERQPNECFSRETWFQADFLKADFALPFADKSFDLVTCGHTIEDLAEPQKLISEISRVGRKGIIECPSRLSEQTLGMRDRRSTEPGHPHHHWIVESIGGQLILTSKEESRLDSPERTLPRIYLDELSLRTSRPDLMFHTWEGSIDYRIVLGPACAESAQAFVQKLSIPAGMRKKDQLFRLLRRLRARLKSDSKETADWWHAILAESRPYSTIPLP